MTIESPRHVAGIDPGKSNGGVVVLDRSTGVVQCHKMPAHMTAQADLLKDIVERCDGDVEFGIEDVGKHAFGNSASSSVVLARHVGCLETALYMLDVRAHVVGSSKWEDHIAQGRPKPPPMKQTETETKDEFDKRRRKARDANKKASKAFIKDKVQRRWPKVKVTDWCADALGIMTYVLENKLCTRD